MCGKRYNKNIHKEFLEWEEMVTKTQHRGGKGGRGDD